MKIQGSQQPQNTERVGKDDPRAQAKKARGKDDEPTAFEKMMRGEREATERASGKAGADEPRGADEKDVAAEDALEARPESEEDAELASEEAPSPDEAAALYERGAEASMTRTESAQAAEATTEAATPPEVDALVDKMVDACFVGRDQQARKVVMLELSLPGRGTIRARLRNERDGVHVRLRATDPETRELLRAHKHELEEGARERGVDLERVDIV